jgi:hypothetical protein
MPVATGVIGDALVTALVTRFHVTAQGGRATVLNRAQRLPLRGGSAVLCQVLVSMLPHHIGHFQPMWGHDFFFASPSVLAK